MLMSIVVKIVTLIILPVRIQMPEIWSIWRVFVLNSPHLSLHDSQIRKLDQCCFQNSLQFLLGPNKNFRRLWRRSI